MDNLEYVLEHFRNKYGITKEQEDLMMEEIRKESPLVLIEKVKEDVADIEMQNAYLLLDSVQKDMHIEANTNDMAALIMELVVGGVI